MIAWAETVDKRQSLRMIDGMDWLVGRFSSQSPYHKIVFLQERHPSEGNFSRSRASKPRYAPFPDLVKTFNQHQDGQT